MIPHLDADDYEKDEKVRAVSMTEAGTNILKHAGEGTLTAAPRTAPQ